MPHLRKRHLEQVFSLFFSPIVGIFGHRQVGKTTFVSQISKEYATFDNPLHLQNCEEHPKSFLLNRSHPFGIDESQLSPALFPALKDHVRIHPRPGQFIITGSVRFSSRRQIRESLTGRIISWELLPMDLSEIHRKPLRHSLQRLMTSKKLDCELQSSSYVKSNTISQYLKYGGLPGLFAIRNERIRQQKLELQLETLLERDLRLLVNTTLTYHSLRTLLSVLASYQNEPLEIYQVSRQTQISVPTIMRLLHGFEAMFLIRFLNSEGTSRKKVLFFEDQAEASYLSPREYGPIQDFIRFLYANLRTQSYYNDQSTMRIYQFRNRGGTYVPLVFEQKGHPPLGVIPILEEEPSKQAAAAARSFIAQRHGRVIFPHTGKTDTLIHPHMRIIPLSKLV